MTIKIYSELSSSLFCTKPQVPPTSGTQRSFSCYSEALCSPATPQHALWWGVTLSESSPIAPSSLLPKGSGTADFTVEAYETTQILLGEESLLLLLILPPSLESSSGSPCTVHYSKAPLLPLGWKMPWHSPSRSSSCAFTRRHCSAETSLHDNVLWARAHLLHLLVLLCITPSFLLDLLKTEPSHNTQGKFAFRPLLHDFAGDFINKGRFYLLN